MNELILPFKVDLKIGKTKSRYPLGTVTIKARYKMNLAIGLCWVSLKVFFMGVKELLK